MIDVRQTTTPHGDEVLTARVVVSAAADGADVVRHIENLDDAIWNHAHENDLIVVRRKVSGRFYYHNSDEANDAHTMPLSKDLQKEHVMALRVWRFVEERLV